MEAVPGFMNKFRIQQEKVKKNNNNTFTWSGPAGYLAAPDNGPECRLTAWCRQVSKGVMVVTLCH
jgi:hypothetical protein